MITTEQIKELRERTGISIGQCKQALEEANGDLAKALELLKDKGTEIAEKKASRDLKAGTISAYVHAGGAKAGMAQIYCESDFVAKNPEFRQLADDLAMHITAMDPADVAELLTQPYIKDPGLTIDDLVKSYVQKFGERIEIAKFARFDTAA